jgi:hypothetical protein
MSQIHIRSHVNTFEPGLNVFTATRPTNPQSHKCCLTTLSVLVPRSPAAISLHTVTAPSMILHANGSLPLSNRMPPTPLLTAPRQPLLDTCSTHGDQTSRACGSEVGIVELCCICVTQGCQNGVVRADVVLGTAKALILFGQRMFGRGVWGRKDAIYCESGRH